MEVAEGPGLVALTLGFSSSCRGWQRSDHRDNAAICSFDGAAEVSHSAGYRASRGEGEWVRGGGRPAVKPVATPWAGGLTGAYPPTPTRRTVSLSLIHI